MEEIKIQQLTDRIWFLPPDSRTDRPVLAIVKGDKYTLMMDAGNSPMHTKFFLNELRRVGINPPDFVVFTHGHWDHVLGYSSLSIPAFAHKRTYEYLKMLQLLTWDDVSLESQVKDGITTAACADYIKKEYGEHRPELKVSLPNFIIDDELQIHLGNVTCLFKHVGGDQASDSCILYIEEEKVLFIGDSTSPCIHAPKRYYRLDHIGRLFNQLQQYDADYVIHSHDLPMSRDRFQLEAKEFKDVIKAVETYGDNLSQIADELKNKWNREIPPEDMVFFQYFINGLMVK